MAGILKLKGREGGALAFVTTSLRCLGSAQQRCGGLSCFGVVLLGLWAGHGRTPTRDGVPVFSRLWYELLQRRDRVLCT